MPRRMRDFKCRNSHITELYIDDETESLVCEICGETAVRVVSPSLIKLEGCTGSFPGAAMAWERKRAEKMRQEQKQNS